MHWGCWTLLFHETSYPLRYGPGDLTDKIDFSMSIDLAGPRPILKDLVYWEERRLDRNYGTSTVLPPSTGFTSAVAATQHVKNHAGFFKKTKSYYILNHVGDFLSQKPHFPMKTHVVF